MLCSVLFHEAACTRRLCSIYMIRQLVMFQRCYSIYKCEAYRRDGRPAADVCREMSLKLNSLRVAAVTIQACHCGSIHSGKMNSDTTSSVVDTPRGARYRPHKTAVVLMSEATRTLQFSGQHVSRAEMRSAETSWTAARNGMHVSNV